MSGASDCFKCAEGRTSFFDEDGDLNVEGSILYLSSAEDLVLFRDFIDREIKRRYDATVKKAAALSGEGGS